MSGCTELEEIHGFKSPSEYRRFHAWLAEQVTQGRLTPTPVKWRYNDGSFDEWWYRCLEEGSVWRLVGLEPPFTGLFEPVDPAHPSGLPFWKSAPGRAVLARQDEARPSG